MNLKEKIWENKRDLDFEIYQSACIGYTKPDGKATILIAGGRNKHGDSLNNLFEYDITSNTYSAKPPMDDKAKEHSLVIKNGYLYSFMEEIVQRIGLSLTEPWEKLHDLEKSSTGPQLVVPYN